MLYQIKDGTLSLQGKCILSHVNFEIRGKEKIAVVGGNGAGKTTLLRLIAGELELDADDKRQGPGTVVSRAVTIGILHQQAFCDLNRTVEEEMMQFFPDEEQYERERFWYEKEYDTLFTGFGFGKEDKKKCLKEFSGGERTKIALIQLFLKRPDILLLDEPTNHLDLSAVEWLETYLKTYDRSVVMVSHDRFFLDETSDVIYELEHAVLTKYVGNYTDYRRQKEHTLRLQQKKYEEYTEEKERLEALIERFKHKPNKAAFARAKKKALERMPAVEKPKREDAGIQMQEIIPQVPGSKRVLECEHLQVGYDKLLLEVTLRIRKGQKTAILGNNGIGKTAFLKTAAGLLEPLDGKCILGNHIDIGYFDQHSGEMSSEKRVLEHFSELFPALTEKDARKILGMYMLGGEMAGKKVKDLSGGEKVRLMLAELLNRRPNFLLLDEPTNHCDMKTKERLEQAFRAYKGTMLFISHDRYFVQNIADSILLFEENGVYFYPFGYRHYLERSKKLAEGETLAARIRAEDQALIEGLKAVPKGERHRLKELSDEETYADWRLEPAVKKMEKTGEQYMLQETKIREEICWYMEEEAYAIQKLQMEQAWQDWHEACMEWYAIWDELEEAWANVTEQT